MPKPRIPIAEQVAEAERAFAAMATSEQYELKTGKLDEHEANARQARREAALATLRYVEKHADDLRAMFR